MPKSAKKSKALSPPSKSLNKTRKIKTPKYKSLRLSKRIKHPKGKLPSSFKLFSSSIKVILRNKKLIGGVTLIYFLLTLMLVKGFGVSSNIAELQETLSSVFGGNGGAFISGLSLFTVLLSNANSVSSEVSGAYQSMLLIIVSLALIWSFRQLHAKNKPKITIRDAFYNGMHPLIPFLGIIIVIGLQLIPLLISSFLYTVVFNGGLATTPIEVGLWVILLFGLSLLSIYMISSSIFALYIVTLPNIKPMEALKSARQLVLYRRWIIMRKIVFLPIALLILAAVIVVPVIIVSATTAEWLFLFLSMASLAIVHSYMYNLYRELIKSE